MKGMTRLAAVVAAALLAGCGGDKPEPRTGDDAAKGDAKAPAETEKKKAAVQAKDRIVQWLGQEASAQVAAMGKELGAELGRELAADPRVLEEAEKLTSAILKDPKVKRELKKIEDKATSGFQKKLQLGWKALTSGGLDAFKKRVTDNTKRIAAAVVARYVKEHVVRDERFAATMKKFLPVLKLKGMVAAVTLQENMSPAISQKVFGIALKLAAAGDSARTAERVEAWIGRCDGHVESEIETLFGEVAELESVSAGLSGLVVEVLGHPTTRRELVEMVLSLTEDPTARGVMVEAYENAAFEKGDDRVRASIEKLVGLEVMDAELFAAMNRLADAPGAPEIIAKHLEQVSEDPALAKQVEQFVIRLISTCGDPTADG